MTGPTRRLARRLAIQPDGEAAHRPAGVPAVRQAYVNSVAANTIGVLIAGDADEAAVGWLGRRPRVGDTVWVALVNGVGVALGVQQAVTETTGSVTATTSAGGSITGTAHGLPAAPMFVGCQYTNPNSVVVIRVTAKSASTFDVNCRDQTGNPIASTSVSFDWYARL